MATAKTFIVALEGDKQTYTPDEYDGRVHVRPSDARLADYVQEFERKHRTHIQRATVTRRGTGETAASYPSEKPPQPPRGGRKAKAGSGPRPRRGKAEASPTGQPGKGSQGRSQRQDAAAPAGDPPPGLPPEDSGQPTGQPRQRRRRRPDWSFTTRRTFPDTTGAEYGGALAPLTMTQRCECYDGQSHVTTTWGGETRKPLSVARNTTGERRETITLAYCQAHYGRFHEECGACQKALAKERRLMEASIRRMDAKIREWDRRERNKAKVA